MVQSCVAIGCKNRKTAGNKLRFFRFPFSNRERLHLWTRATRRANWTPTRNSSLCANHFQTGQPQLAPDHPDYIPNVFAHTKGKLKGNAELWEKRKDRLHAREEKNIQNSWKNTGLRCNLCEIKLLISQKFCCDCEATAAMEFVNISEPAEAATLFKQEVPDPLDDFASTSSFLMEEVGTLGTIEIVNGSATTLMEEVDTLSTVEIVDGSATTLSEEMDTLEVNIEGDKALQTDILMEYQKVIKSNIELRNANSLLAVNSSKLNKTNTILTSQLRNCIAALAKSSIAVKSSNAALAAIKVELSDARGVAAELRKANVALVAEKQELTEEVQTLERRDVVIKSLIDENERLTNKIAELKSKLESKDEMLNKSISSCHFLDDATRCKFYTGLPNKEMFDTILEETLKILPPDKIRVLTSDQKLLIVLMKLKFNYWNEDIANRFHVSFTTVSNAIKAWLPYVAQVLGSHIVWPSKDDIKQSLPACFKCPNFEDTVCIFHCFEISTEKCSNMSVPTLTNKKSFTKIKFLVGIAPHGAVTFVSEGLAGKVSDDDVALHSGVLEKLRENDVVLVDYEYLGHEEFSKRGVRLVIPSLKKQNESKAELIYNSEVTHLLRSHIQRVIGRLRKFKVLSEVLSHYDVLQVGHIVKACAGIVNLRPPIVQCNEGDQSHSHQVENE